MLACLALFAGGTSARAMPEVAAVVAVSVEQRAPERPLLASRVPVREVAREPRFHTRASFARRVPEVRPPGPPRRLFIAHRALLR